MTEICKTSWELGEERRSKKNVLNSVNRKGRRELKSIKNVGNTLCTVKRCRWRSKQKLYSKGPMGEMTFNWNLQGLSPKGKTVVA